MVTTASSARTPQRPDRLVLCKYDPVVHCHVDFREDPDGPQRRDRTRKAPRAALVERYAGQRST
jgi:hypothetical protein